MNSQNVFLGVVFTAILFVVNCGVTKGEEINISRPEVTLSSVIPVVDRELEIRIGELASLQGEAEFSVSYEGKIIQKETVKLVDNKIVRKWTPRETGFYTAAFDFGKTSKLGVVELKFPVVYKDLYFLRWPVLVPTEEKASRYLSAYVITTAKASDETISYWRSRGSKVLVWVSDEASSGDELVARWSATAERFDGLYIDEFGAYPDSQGLEKLRMQGEALLRFRKENPDILIFPCLAGAPLREAATMFKKSGCILLLETYESWCVAVFGTHSWKKQLDYRVMITRNTDLIYEKGKKHAALIFLGIDGLCGGTTIPQIEESIRYIKKTAPEMPGIAFYGSGKATSYMIDTGIYESIEGFCLKYYIKPVVDIRDIRFSNYSPAVGDECDILINVHNLGGMDAKNVRLKLFAVESGKSKKQQIGKQITIKKIGCGYVVRPKKDKSKDYEYQEVDGNRVPIMVDGGICSTIYRDRTTVKISWRPKKKGYYTIIAETEPSENYTILDGTITKTILVR